MNYFKISLLFTMLRLIQILKHSKSVKLNVLIPLHFLYNCATKTWQMNYCMLHITIYKIIQNVSNTNTLKNINLLNKTLLLHLIDYINLLQKRGKWINWIFYFIIYKIIQNVSIKRTLKNTNPLNKTF